MTNQFHPLEIVGVTPETDSAVVVSLFVPDEVKNIFSYSPGQYLTLRQSIEGNVLRRSYSICSGIHDELLQIAIKRVDGGVFSNFANDNLKPGAVIYALPPQGSFSVDLTSGPGNYLFIAAGSGITPVISNIRSTLAVDNQNQITLLYGNQRTSSIMFLEALSFIKNRYMERFHWINILSREDQGVDLLNGHIDNSKGAALNQKLIDLGVFDEYYICGPESMISTVSRGLREIGVAEEHIHYELFAASEEDARSVVEKHHARARTYSGKFSDVTLIVDGRASNFELPADGENLLDAGIHHGMSIPYSCKGGVCSTCKAKLVSGEVDMDITHGLEDAEIKAGYILTCQSHPISDSVIVDFDQ